MIEFIIERDGQPYKVEVDETHPMGHPIVHLPQEMRDVLIASLLEDLNISPFSDFEDLNAKATWCFLNPVSKDEIEKDADNVDVVDEVRPMGYGMPSLRNGPGALTSVLGNKFEGTWFFQTDSRMGELLTITNNESRGVSNANGAKYLVIVHTDSSNNEYDTEQLLHLGDLFEEASSNGLHVLDALYCNNERYKSIMCDDEDCCPSEGKTRHALDEEQYNLYAKYINK